jgi:hypothetical protein
VKSAAGEQLALLPAEELGPAGRSRELARIEWSYSRRVVLERCPRQYYYEYFGASAREAVEEPLKPALRVAKETSNRHLRVGDLVHAAIARHFRGAQKGTPVALDQLEWSVLTSFRADRDRSRAVAAGRYLTQVEQFPPVVLREYVHAEPEVEQLMDQAEERLVAALRSFAGSAVFEPLRLAGRGPDAVVEAPFHLRGLTCRVQGKVDLGYPTPDGAVVVDWKLGDTEHEGHDSLQLAVYALWGIERFGRRPGTLRLLKAFLRSGEVREYAVDEDMRRMARLRIAQDAERMAAMEGYGADGVADAFPAVARRRVCSHCPFRGVCPEALEVLAA